jgi:hypothetical protein
MGTVLPACSIQSQTSSLARLGDLTSLRFRGATEGNSGCFSNVLQVAQHGIMENKGTAKGVD